MGKKFFSIEVGFDVITWLLLYKTCLKDWSIFGYYWISDVLLMFESDWRCLSLDLYCASKVLLFVAVLLLLLVVLIEVGEELLLLKELFVVVMLLAVT